MQLNQHGAAFHFVEGGMPHNWCLSAVYGGDYGVAVNSAESWHLKQGTGQALVEVNRHHQVMRCELWLDGTYGQHPNAQYPPLSDKYFHTQWHAHPCGGAVPLRLVEVVTGTLLEMVRKHGAIMAHADRAARYPEAHAHDEEARRQMAELMGRAPRPS